MKKLLGRGQGAMDVGILFCDLRVVRVRGLFYPVEVAMLGAIDDEPHIWSSRIYPALSWSQQILAASPIDLSAAPPATDVANEALERIDRCSAGWLHSDSPATSTLLQRLLAEADVGYLLKVDVLSADQLMQDDLGSAMKEQLKIHKRISDDPKEEVARLWRCYEEAQHKTVGRLS